MATAIPHFDQVLDNNGDPVSGARVHFKVPDTNTNETAWTDEDLTVPAANPFIADSAGRYLVYLSSERGYDISRKSADDATQFGATIKIPSNIAGAQPVDATLTAISALGLENRKFIRGSGVDTGELVTISQATDVINVKDYGAVGDGSTDDEAALILAFAAAAGKRMYFPKGTYRVAFTSTTCFTLPADVTIEGEDRDSTIIDFVPSSTTYRNGFSGVDGLTVRDMTIKMSIPAGGSGSIFVAGTRMKIQNCLLDGTVTDNGAAASHTAYMLVFPSSGTQEDIHVSGCEIKRFTFDFLKANSDTSIQRRITVVDNDFHTTYREAATFNSPLGTMEDVRVNFNRFRAHAGILIGSTSLFVAFASVNRFQCIGNTFSGAITDAIHIEENCIDGVVSGNVLDVDGNGIVILENNVSGSYAQPDGLIVANNVVRKDGTNRGAGKYGIWLVNNASADLPGKRILIEGNQVHSFDDGFKIETVAANVAVVRGNLAYDCESGFWTNSVAASVAFMDNTSASCAIGIYSEGGLFVSHKFVSNTTNVDAVTLHTTLQDPVVELPITTAGAGSTTNTNIFPMGADARLRADITITGFTSTTADRSTVVETCTWDGVTFARTNNLSYAPGGIVLSARENSGNLALRLFSTSAVTNVRISAAFAGVYVIAV